MSCIQKLENIKVLADAMYYAAQYLTTDASKLHKAMNEYHQFIINECYKEEPVSDELEEAANTYIDNWYKRNDLDKESYPIDVEISKNDFKAGAEWQKKQDQSIIELAEDHAMLAGMEKMKEKMMEKAVDGVLSSTITGSEQVVSAYVGYGEYGKDGDKVKVIVIKKD